MSPYRTPGELEDEPMLDRLPVRMRFPGMIGGWIVVGPRTLQFEPRFGGVQRVASIEEGVDGLRLSSWWFDLSFAATMTTPATAKSVASWTRIVTSAPFQNRRARPDRSMFLFNVNSYYVLSGGDHANNPAYLGVIDGERLVVLMEDVSTFDACFDTKFAWPDDTARLLGTALSWLKRAELDAAIERVSRVERAGLAAMRVFTRADVSAGRVGKAFWRLGNDPHDAIELRPDAIDADVLARWLG